MIPIAALSVVGALIFVVLGFLIASLRRGPAAAAQPLADGSNAELLTQLDQATARSNHLEASLASAVEEKQSLTAELEQLRHGSQPPPTGLVDDERQALLQQVSEERTRAERAESEREGLAGQLRAERQRADLADAARAKAEEALEDDLDQTISDMRQSPLRTTQKMFPKKSGDADVIASLKHDLQVERERHSVVEEAKTAAEARVGELEGELEEARLSMTLVEERPEDYLDGEPTAVVTLADPETLAQSEKEVARLRKEVSRLSVESRSLVKLKGEHKKQGTLLEEAKGKLAEARRQLEDARKKLDASKKTGAELTKTRTELTRTKQQLVKLQKELSAAKQQLQRTKSDAQRTEKELETARGDLEHDAEAQAAEAKGLSEENRRLREQLAERGSLMSELSGMESELAEARQKARTAESRGEELERFREENRSLRDARAHDESIGRELEEARSELREAQIKAQTAESRGEEVERLLAENQRIREDLRDLEDLRAESEELSSLKNEHQNLRLESEVMGRKLEELERMEAECVELRGRVEELGREADDARSLRERLSSLEAQLFAAGQTPRDSSLQESIEGRSDRVLAEHGPIDDILAKMAAASDVRSAVVADLQGLLVGGVGEGGYHEEMAAISGTAEDLSVRATGILPLDRIHTVCLNDVNQLVLSCHYFKSGGDTFALTALRRDAPLSSDVVEQTIAKLTTALEG